MKKLLAWVVLTVALFSLFASAEQICPENEFQNGTLANLTAELFYENGTIGASFWCQLHVAFPNGTLQYSYVNMTEIPAGNGNYHLEIRPVTTGFHRAVVNCTLGNYAGVTPANFISVASCSPTRAQTTQELGEIISRYETNRSAGGAGGIVEIQPQQDYSLWVFLAIVAIVAYLILKSEAERGL